MVLSNITSARALQERRTPKKCKIKCTPKMMVASTMVHVLTEQIVLQEPPRRKHKLLSAFLCTLSDALASLSFTTWIDLNSMSTTASILVLRGPHNKNNVAVDNVVVWWTANQTKEHVSNVPWHIEKETAQTVSWTREETEGTSLSIRNVQTRCTKV